MRGFFNDLNDKSCSSHLLRLRYLLHLSNEILSGHAGRSIRIFLSPTVSLNFTAKTSRHITASVTSATFKYVIIF